MFERLSMLSKRTKTIVGAMLTLSLALNFFLVGWVGGSSSLFPGQVWLPFGKEAGLPHLGPKTDQPPELWFIRVLSRGISEVGQRKIWMAVKNRAEEFRDLNARQSQIRENIATLMLEPEPDRAQIEKLFMEHEQIMRQRVQGFFGTLLPVVLELGLSDRKLLVERLTRLPEAPPPPRF